MKANHKTKNKNDKTIFLLSVDAEEEFNWNGSFPQENCEVTNIQRIPKLQKFCEFLELDDPHRLSIKMNVATICKEGSKPHADVSNSISINRKLELKRNKDVVEAYQLPVIKSEAVMKNPSPSYPSKQLSANDYIRSLNSSNTNFSGKRHSNRGSTEMWNGSPRHGEHISSLRNHYNNIINSSRKFAVDRNQDSQRFKFQSS